MSILGLLILGLVLVVCSACQQSHSVAPSAPSVSTPAPPTAEGVSGTIIVRELNPGTGSTLAVQHNCIVNGRARLCIGDWDGGFDVQVNRAMSHAVLTVSFYDGQAKCGYAAATLDVVPADRQVFFSMSRIELSDEFGLTSCHFPTTTTRALAELWSDSSGWSLTQELASTKYTFVDPEASLIEPLFIPAARIR
jgi:hypothetical protein